MLSATIFVLWLFLESIIWSVERIGGGLNVTTASNQWLSRRQGRKVCFCCSIRAASLTLLAPGNDPVIAVYTSDPSSRMSGIGLYSHPLSLFIRVVITFSETHCRGPRD